MSTQFSKRSEEILQILDAFNEMPRKLICGYLKDNPQMLDRYTQQSICQLELAGAIKQVETNESFRKTNLQITDVGRNYLRKSNMYKNNYYHENAQIMLPVNRDKTRIQRLVESISICRLNGIKAYPQEKKRIEEIILALSSSQEIEPSYYTSIEVKQYLKEISEDIEKISSSRFVGIIITKEKTIVVYNTLNRKMRWEERIEDKLEKKIRERIRGSDGEERESESLIIGTSEKQMCEIMMEGIGRKSRKNPSKLESGTVGVEKLWMYKNAYYIAKTSEDVKELEKILKEEPRKEIKEINKRKCMHEHGMQYVDIENGEKIGNIDRYEMKEMLRILKEVREVEIEKGRETRQREREMIERIQKQIGIEIERE